MLKERFRRGWLFLFPPLPIFSHDLGGGKLICIMRWLSSRPEGTRNQADAIAAEGVEVTRGNLGEYQIDLTKYGWFPDVLPSEEGNENN